MLGLSDEELVVNSGQLAVKTAEDLLSAYFLIVAAFCFFRGFSVSAICRVTRFPLTIDETRNEAGSEAVINVDHGHIRRTRI